MNIDKYDWECDGFTGQWWIVDLETSEQYHNNDTVELLNDLYNENLDLKDQEHSIEELYDFRLTYNALLFNEWHEHGTYEVYKSRRHSDGELCFEGEWFVVVAILPCGQITNHYHIDYWDYFKIPVYEQVKDEFDGHTSKDVLDRLTEVINAKPKIYEVWYDFYDGTMANNNGYQKRVKTFATKQKALEEIDFLNNQNSQFQREKPYYLKEVELDG